MPYDIYGNPTDQATLLGTGMDTLQYGNAQPGTVSWYTGIGNDTTPIDARRAYLGKFDKPGYMTFDMPKDQEAFKNGAEYINQLVQSGAKYFDGTPVTAGNIRYGEYVHVPESKIGNIPGPQVANIDTFDFMDYALPATAAILGGAALSGAGMFGSSSPMTGLAAGNVASSTGATLADLYGNALGMSVTGAPVAATGSTLYGAATGALPAFVGGATGNMLTSSPDVVSGFTNNPLYQAATGGTSVPAGVTDSVGNTLINQSQYGSLLQSVPEGAVNAFGQPLGTAMSTTPELAQSLLSSAGIPPGTSTSVFDSLGNLLSGNSGKLVSGALSGIGGLLSGNSATNAAQTQADAIVRAAQIAADAAKFRPVGITTRFGQSQFGYDANGNLVTAGYGLKPDIKAQQDSLMGESGQLLNQYLGANEATAPMGAAAQSIFGLGHGYLGTTPEQQAAKYMAEQQALLAPTRERELAALEARLAAQGRLGLATGGTSTMSASNPELEALFNARRMQDLKLASEATQGGMDYAKFGAGMMGTGGDLLKSMYGTQSAAYQPYNTAIGGASYLEGLGQNAMDMGINIGAKGTAANAQAGQLLASGMTNAANVMAPANAYSPWGALLSGAGNAVSQYANPQNQYYRFDPFTGKAL